MKNKATGRKRMRLMLGLLVIVTATHAGAQIPAPSIAVSSATYDKMKSQY